MSNTPTDDERDRKHAECCGCDLPGCEFMAGWIERDKAGFRRSEVPEPGAECASCQGECGGGRHCCENCVHTQPQGEPCDAQRIGCNICGEALPDGEPHLCSEPQGEPSDAQRYIDIALGVIALGVIAREGGDIRVKRGLEHARAALRAVGGVR